MQKKIKIYDLDVEYAVNYRPVHYPRLEFKTGNLMLILPKTMNQKRKLLKLIKMDLQKHKEYLILSKQAKIKVKHQ